MCIYTCCSAAQTVNSLQLPATHHQPHTTSHTTDWFLVLQALKFIGGALYPLIIGYALYSLLHTPHKSW